MQKKLQVFLSSTYTDMQEERAAAVMAILDAGHIPAGMELFAADDKSQWETIKKWIDDSDVFMLILGGRYGSIEKESGKSYIELEYNYAQEKNKPFFSLVISESALQNKVKRKNGLKDNTEKDFPEKLKAFREKVRSKNAPLYEDIKDIALTVHKSLREYENDPRVSGWVRENDVPDSSALLNMLDQLRIENESLKKQVGLFAKQKGKKESETDRLKNIKEMMEQQTIDTKEIKSRKPGMLDDISDSILTQIQGLREKTTLLHLFFVLQDQFISGIEDYGNATMESTIKNYLFHEICPALELYDLVKADYPRGKNYRRSEITDFGKKFLIYLKKTNCCSIKITPQSK